MFCGLWSIQPSSCSASNALRVSNLRFQISNLKSSTPMCLVLHHCVGLKANRDGFMRRRDLLKVVSKPAIVGGLAGGLLHWTDLVTAQGADLRRRGMACILLWMQGGPSQFETFSPKPGHPNGGETKAIPTAVP